MSQQNKLSGRATSATRHRAYQHNVSLQTAAQNAHAHHFARLNTDTRTRKHDQQSCTAKVARSSNSSKRHNQINTRHAASQHLQAADVRREVEAPLHRLTVDRHNHVASTQTSNLARAVNQTPHKACHCHPSAKQPRCHSLGEHKAVDS